MNIYSTCELKKVLHDDPIRLLTAQITELLDTAGGHWTGTATQLMHALGLRSTTPRALVVELQKHTTYPENAGISLTQKKVRGKRLISLSQTRRITATQSSTIDVTTRMGALGCSKISTPKRTTLSVPEPECEPLTRFEWQYALIEELTLDEKVEKNKFYTANKHHSSRRPCSGCGAPGRGKLEFRKRWCAPYPDKFLCRACAEDYVRKARRLMPEIARYYEGGDL